MRILAIIALFFKKKWDDLLFGAVPGSTLSLTYWQDYVNIVDWGGIVNTTLIGFFGGLGGFLGKHLGDKIFNRYRSKKEES